MDKLKQEILTGAERAFTDSSVLSQPLYTPQFMSNSGQEKVITLLDEELRGCDEFLMSVAFITPGGLTPLKMTLKELEKKGVKGRIITTDYLSFTDPKALDDLQKMKNIQLKMYRTAEGVGFHTKAYIFKNGEITHIIMGSSNLTKDALMRNHEWNNKLVTTQEGDYRKQITSAFEDLWNQSDPYLDYASQYRTQFEEQKKRMAEINKYLQNQPGFLLGKPLEPNKMQMEFTQNLVDLVKQGAKRALLVSATGTGKTYASAFGVKTLFEELDFRPKKVLFLSHREQINKQAMISYQNVFGRKYSMGLLSGNHEDEGFDFLFSTMQTMAKDDVMQRYDKNEFSIIILDECHRSGAPSYQKIVNYFNPSLLLGMSASPERMDDFNVYEFFNFNTVYEIRLQRALEEEMLCPFHYFGITDFDITDEDVIGARDDFRQFSKLVSDARVHHIIENAQYFGYSGNRVKGLVFCSSTKEAAELSLKFNEEGYKTVALSGANTQEEREAAIAKLITDNPFEPQLDYIFTVDIFNEGVDVPEINQIIMLRPTQSPVIFVQQLGRGLRHAVGKEFVVVLDFIGNYDNNYMIPIALSGNTTGNKDDIRRTLTDSTVIGGATIHMDEIARAHIYESIDKVKMNEMKKLVDGYKNLKFKLGRIPCMMDFENYEAIDIMRIIASQGSYYKFLEKKEKDYLTRLSEMEANYVEFVSKNFAKGKRIHELEFLNLLLQETSDVLEAWKRNMWEKYQFNISEITEKNVINVLNGTFFAIGAAASRARQIVFVEEDAAGKIQIAERFAALLKNFKFREIFQEVVDFGIHRYNKNYKIHYLDTSLKLYEKYSYEDVCRLLCWEKNEVSLNIGGYKYDKFSNTYPVYINYVKQDVVDTQDYEDEFLDQGTLIAISKSYRSLKSDDVQKFLNSEKLGIAVHLFVRKNKDDKETKEFYYLGRMRPTGWAEEFKMPVGADAVKIQWKLDRPVPKSLYEYITKV